MKKFLSIVCVLAIAVSAFAQDGKKYEIKSGIAKMITEVMGQKIEATVYFDNYGALEASKMNAMGQTLTCTVWVWKGLAIKNVAKAGEMEMIATITELQENAEVDSSVFDVPTF